MRLCSSGASHLAHIARGALPNIAPPSSFWLLPSMDQSFIAVASVIACRHGNAAGFDWRSAAYAPPDPSPSPACGRRCPAGADEGASAASCFCVSPGKQIKSTLRCARAPYSGASRPLLPQAGEGLRSGLIPSGASRTAYGEESSTFAPPTGLRSEEHTSELQSLMRISYAAFCLKKKKYKQQHQ